jgi:hypothetical protein
VYRATTTVKDISNNLLKQNVADVGLRDPANIDYHLVEGSEAIGAGTNAGVTSHGFDLTPIREYVHAANGVDRETACNISVGAYEYGTSEPAVVQVSADKTVLYYGYAPEATATLAVSATSDRTPYQYLWSTGETGDTISVNPTTTTSYSVTVIDAVGCEFSGNVTVEVVDVRCGPAHHQKVMVCNRAGQQICVDANAVPAHLLNGGALGGCGGDDNVGGTVLTMEGLVVAAYPNPFSERVRIEITSENEEHIIFEVHSLNGAFVKRVYEGSMKPGEVKHLEIEGSQLNERLYVGKIITKRGVETINLVLKR